jgi:phenylacetate-CoA ligase
MPTGGLTLAQAACRAIHQWQYPLRTRILRELLDHERLSASALHSLQQRALSDILRYTRERVPYYRAQMQGAPALPDLADFPVLTRQTLRNHLPALLADGFDPDTTPIGHTSGSTGEPVRFYVNTEKHEIMRAGMMRSYMRCGWQPGMGIVNFWGAAFDTAPGGFFAANVLQEKIAAEKTLCARILNAPLLARWCRLIQRTKPVVLQGYASVLGRLAAFVLDERCPMPRSIRGVYPTAEMLRPEQRILMERAFDCRVFNHYGSREIPNIACECAQGQMHVYTDLVALEVAEQGRLRITSLTNRLMPMIRYDNGDIGSLSQSPCSCGLPFPVMSMALGRHGDLITGGHGEQIHPAYFSHLLYDSPVPVQAFQCVQDTAGAITLYLVSEPALPPVFLDALSRRLREQTGLSLTVHRVSSIDPDPVNGKQRYVICRLAQDKNISCSG